MDCIEFFYVVYWSRGIVRVQVVDWCVYVVYCYLYVMYCVFIRWSNYVCVIGCCVIVDDFCIDMCVVCQSVFQFFDNNYIVIICDDKFIMVCIIGMGCFFRCIVIFGGQCFYCVEFIGYFLVQFFVVVSKNDVLFVQLDLFNCIVDIVCGGCVSGVNGVVYVINFKWCSEVGGNVGCYCFCYYIWVYGFQIMWVMYGVCVKDLEFWGVVVGICNQVDMWVILIDFWCQIGVGYCLFYRQISIDGGVVYKVYDFVVNEVSGIQFYVVLYLVMYVGVFQFLRESDF